jgi:hypothetical protein
MESFITFLIVLIIITFEFGFDSPFSIFGDFFRSEWMGFLGASAVLILSLGRIQWENNDWRARGMGVALLLVGTTLLWFHFFKQPTLV